MASLKRYYKRGALEAGCDEAGRGCLAGPVVAASVILPAKFNHPLLNDSKQLTQRQRDLLRPLIEAESLAWGVGIVSVQEIDEINILNASFLAMHRAVDQMELRPELLLIDGNRFNAYAGIPHACIIKGDALFRSIAAASILAKTHRDEIMEGLHALHSNYKWSSNKGYPTQVHRNAIREFGATLHHRMSFTLLPEQLRLPLEA